MMTEIDTSVGIGALVVDLSPDFSLERPVPLTSRKLNISVIKAIVRTLQLPSTGTKEETVLIIEGKLAEDGHEPQNVQISIIAREESDMLDMELIGEDGPFHQVELKRAATGSTAEVGTEQEASDSEPEDDNDNHTVTELRQLGEENDHLKERVSELEAQLAKVTTRMKSLWKANCSLSREFEETLEEKDAEIECLKHQLSDLQSEASSTTLTTIYVRTYIKFLSMHVC